MTICEYNVLYKKLNNFLYTKIVIKKLYKQMTVTGEEDMITIEFNCKTNDICISIPRKYKDIIGNPIYGIQHNNNHTHCYVPQNRSNRSSCNMPMPTNRSTNNIGPTNNIQIINPEKLYERPTGRSGNKSIY